MTTQEYSFIIPEETTARATDYLGELISGAEQPGTLLRDTLQGVATGTLTAHDLLCTISSPDMCLPALDIPTMKSMKKAPKKT